jgi:hypothetical protein
MYKTVLFVTKISPVALSISIWPFYDLQQKGPNFLLSNTFPCSRSFNKYLQTSYMMIPFLQYSQTLHAWALFTCRKLHLQ